MSENQEINQLELDKNLILKELEKYKQLKSFVTTKRLSKNTNIKKKRVLKILKDMEEAKEYSYINVGNGIADKKLWGL